MRIAYFIFAFLFLTNTFAQVPESEWKREVRSIEIDRRADVQLPEEELVAIEGTPRSLAAGNWAYNYLGFNQYGAQLAKDAAPITIFIFDTGISRHKYLRDITNYQESFSVTNEPVTDDLQGHATHVAGCAAALHPNLNIGILSEWVKLGKVELVFVKVLTHGGSGSYPQITEGTLRAIPLAEKRLAQNRIVAFNYSLGGSSPDAQLKAALDAATAKGVLIFGATGNTGSRGVNYPGRYVIPVGSIDESGRRSSFSTFGPEVQFAAPGSFILSTYRDTLAVLSGTSMATPIAAATAAAALSVHKGVVIQTLATDITPTGRDEDTGFGTIFAATIANYDGTPPPPPPVDTVKVPHRNMLVRLPMFEARWHYQGGQVNFISIDEIVVRYRTNQPDNVAIDQLIEAHNAYTVWTLVPRNEDQHEQITRWIGHFHNLIVGRRMDCRVVRIIGTDDRGRSVIIEDFPKVSVKNFFQSLSRNQPSIYAQPGLPVR